MNDAPPHYLDGFLAALGQERRGVACPPLLSAELPAEATPAPTESPAAAKTETDEEQVKARLHPLDAFPRLLDCVRQNRPPDLEDQFRFQWFGLFYQGPRQDAFLLRLRLPGGRLKPFQLAGLAELGQACAGGHVLLNSAGGLDVPGVPVRAAAEILRAIEGIGLSARQTGGDCVQAVRGGAYEGLGGAEEVARGIYPLIVELEQALAHSRPLSDLPEPCEVIFRGVGDGSFQEPTGREQAIVWQAVAGPPATPETASAPSFLCVPPGCHAGGFPLEAAQVVTGCLALLGAWAAHGDRTRRQGAGLAEYCAGLGREQVGALLGKTSWRPEDHSPGTDEAAGARKLPAGLAIPGGRLLSGQLARLAEVAREAGLPDLRLADGRLHFARAGPEAGLARDLGAALA